MSKVSIIVPLYNKAPYVTKALESIASQTYKDWECIVVNDGSTDNSLEIVASWLASNPSISSADSSKCNSIKQVPCPSIRLVHQENAGVSAARNHGISLYTGDFVAFLDADDWWAPTFLEEMMGLAEDYPEAGLWASNYIYYKPGKTHVAICNIETGYFNYPKAYYEGVAMPITSISVLIRRDVFNTVGMFPVGIKLGEDFLLWSKIALNYKVAFLNRPLAYYNNDIPASQRATRNLHVPETHMLWHLGEIEDRIQKIEDCNLRDDWKRLFDRLRVKGLQKYWLSNKYHEVAQRELEKVDWTKQSLKVRLNYNMPIFVVRVFLSLMYIGSFVKQHCINIIWR